MKVLKEDLHVSDFVHQIHALPNEESLKWRGIEAQKEQFNFLICVIYPMEVDLPIINIKG